MIRVAVRSRPEHAVTLPPSRSSTNLPSSPSPKRKYYGVRHRPWGVGVRNQGPRHQSAELAARYDVKAVSLYDRHAKFNFPLGSRNVLMFIAIDPPAVSRREVRGNRRPLRVSR